MVTFRSAVLFEPYSEQKYIHTVGEHFQIPEKAHKERLNRNP